MWIRIRGSVQMTYGFCSFRQWPSRCHWKIICFSNFFISLLLLTSVLHSRSREPKLNCLQEPEPNLRIAAPAPSYSPDFKKFYRKIMVAEEFFVNSNNFIPIKPKRYGNVHLIKHLIKTIWSQGQSRISDLGLRGDRRKYFRLWNTVFLTIFAWWWKDPVPDPYRYNNDGSGRTKTNFFSQKGKIK